MDVLATCIEMTQVRVVRSRLVGERPDVVSAARAGRARSGADRSRPCLAQRRYAVTEEA